MKLLLTSLLVTTGLTGLASTAPTNSSLPIITLPYVRQRATLYDSKGDYYLFANVRFAAPPTGSRRFQLPVPPEKESDIQDGSQYGLEAACTQYVVSTIPIPGVPPGGIDYGKEDCLFVDLYVPSSILEGGGGGGGGGTHNASLAPVLAWWHGGADILGSKSLTSMNGLLAAGDHKMIIASFNYRLGVYGWLAPPSSNSSTSSKTITPNLGLHDVRAGLAWLTNHIKAFGGDSDQVTAMGESAGGSVLALTLVSTPLPSSPDFKLSQVLLQSAWWMTEPPDQSKRTATYKAFLTLLNGTDPFKASTAAIKAANKDLSTKVLSFLDPHLSFSPFVDDKYITATPYKLLKSGKSLKLKSIIAANNRYEGAIFATKNTTETEWQHQVPGMFYTASNATLAKIFKLYNGVAGASSPYEKSRDLQTDVLFACVTRAFAVAYSKTKTASYRYIFNAGTAAHGEDLLYTFYNGTLAKDFPFEVDTSRALVHQKAIADYVLTGKPGWKQYEEESGWEAGWLNGTGKVEVGESVDPWAPGGSRDEKCKLFEESAEWL